MARTLNPQLFGPSELPQARSLEVPTDTNARKFRDMEAQIDRINQKVDQWAKIVDTRHQQLQSAQKALHEQLKRVAENFSAQQAAIHSKLNERKSADAKVQDLIDRHNQLVQTFELRLGQLQKVTRAQAIKLMAYQATYDEVLREVRNLSRR